MQTCCERATCNFGSPLLVTRSGQGQEHSMRVINRSHDVITWGRGLYILEALVTKRARMEQWSLDWTVLRWRALRDGFPHFYWSRPVPQTEDVQRAVCEVDNLRRLAKLARFDAWPRWQLVRFHVESQEDRRRRCDLVTV